MHTSGKIFRQTMGPLQLLNSIDRTFIADADFGHLTIYEIDSDYSSRIIWTHLLDDIVSGLCFTSLDESHILFTFATERGLIFVKEIVLREIQHTTKNQSELGSPIRSGSFANLRDVVVSTAFIKSDESIILVTRSGGIYRCDKDLSSLKQIVVVDNFGKQYRSFGIDTSLLIDNFAILNGSRGNDVISSPVLVWRSGVTGMVSFTWTSCGPPASEAEGATASGSSSTSPGRWSVSYEVDLLSEDAVFSTTPAAMLVVGLGSRVHIYGDQGLLAVAECGPYIDTILGVASFHAIGAIGGRDATQMSLILSTPQGKYFNMMMNVGATGVPPSETNANSVPVPPASTGSFALRPLAAEPLCPCHDSQRRYSFLPFAEQMAVIPQLGVRHSDVDGARIVAYHSDFGVQLLKLSVEHQDSLIEDLPYVDRDNRDFHPHDMLSFGSHDGLCGIERAVSLRGIGKHIV
jgi:hypothetical protein